MAWRLRDEECAGLQLLDGQSITMGENRYETRGEGEFSRFEHAQFNTIAKMTQSLSLQRLFFVKIMPEEEISR